MRDIFEKKVLEGFIKSLSSTGSAIENCRVIGVAVSGGADSVSLLCALKEVLPKNILLKAVTVNHNIRPSEETCGDAEFTENLCREIGVTCVRMEIKAGKVFEFADEKKCGLEDSARKLRYEKFSEFMENEDVDFLCLAHNKNDQAETVIMRFLQGSSDLSGIPWAREKFLRPLLGISRSEIEAYLEEIKVSYRTDSTNHDNTMLRNRIRNVLTPVLNGNFEGWQKALCSLSEKSKADNEFIGDCVEDALQKIVADEKTDKVVIDAGRFFSLAFALRSRALLESVKKLGALKRVPYGFMERWADESYAGKKKKEECSGITISLASGKLVLEKKNKVATEGGFFVIIEEPGIFSAGKYIFKVELAEGSVVLTCDGKSMALKGLCFPFAIRSRQSGDEIECSDGSFKAVSEILSGWKAGGARDSVPLVQMLSSERKEDLQKIKCIWGSLCGLKDWIVTG